MKKIYIIVLAVLLCLVVWFFYFKDEKVYTFKEYSPSGKLIGTNEYVIRNGNSIQHGKFVNYNERGIKIAEGNFVNNEPNGKSIYYFDNGKIESVHYRKNSKVTEESIFYNSDGLIRKYIMYNDIGEAKFIIDFDGKTVKKYDGYATYPVNQYKIEKEKKYEINTRDTLKVGDVIKYEYLLANIPNAKRTFKIETEGIDNSKVKRTITKEVPTRIVVEEVLTKKGLNRIKAITQYTFNDNVTRVKNDTVTFDVNVK
ncbi:hypothetical protein ASF10_23295 [Flavobacterium sp. Leaf82]|uniref:hypothetical protein n=1 Tax=Flavobacterium sp. Leaf82 TaxID=1736238 RepID=UPI0007004604|nr:hypothetical protein [Flavobacterium sp. Leaf82]KQO27270.1 hypothetical protein ASF10_23295 [Flavobacterium sp. Leaf82]